MSSELWRVGWVALLVTLLVTPVLARWLISRRIMDLPGERRSHQQPTPRGGGLAMLLGLVLALLSAPGEFLALLPLLVYAFVLGALGWLEDRHELPVRLRLAVMTTCAMGLVLHFGPVTQIEAFGIVLPWAWLWTLLAVVAVVWLINLHNFMDGSDGLAAMQGAWSAGVLGWLLYQGGAVAAGLAGIALAGACLGFLAWNRPPARLFMGDVGSLMIGGLIGLLAYAGAAEGIVSIWVSLIVCSLFVVDATATLARRVSGGGQWYTPHREHAYQRLIQAGWSHARVLVLYAVVNLALVLPLVLLVYRYPLWEWLAAMVLVATLLVGWTVVQRYTAMENRTA